MMKVGESVVGDFWCKYGYVDLVFFYFVFGSRLRLIRKRENKNVNLNFSYVRRYMLKYRLGLFRFVKIVREFYRRKRKELEEGVIVYLKN